MGVPNLGESRGYARVAATSRVAARRAALALLALLALACACFVDTTTTSSAGDSATSTTDASTSESASGPASGPASAAQTSASDDTTWDMCALGYEACVACCAEAVPASLEFFGALEPCACNPGTCEPACAGSLCAGELPTLECLNCVLTSETIYTLCGAGAVVPCMIDDECERFLACTDKNDCTPYG